MLSKFQGVPWEPTPGRAGVEINSHVDLRVREDEPRMIPEPSHNEILMRRAQDNSRC